MAACYQMIPLKPCWHLTHILKFSLLNYLFSWVSRATHEPQPQINFQFWSVMYLSSEWFGIGETKKELEDLKLFRVRLDSEKYNTSIPEVSRVLYWKIRIVNILHLGCQIWISNQFDFVSQKVLNNWDPRSINCQSMSVKFQSN